MEHEQKEGTAEKEGKKGKAGGREGKRKGKGKEQQSDNLKGPKAKTEGRAKGQGRSKGRANVHQKVYTDTWVDFTSSEAHPAPMQACFEPDLTQHAAVQLHVLRQARCLQTPDLTPTLL